jgi:hypothetical protein
MAELVYETALGAIEGTAGTPEAAPNRVLNTMLSITPRSERVTARENRGTLVRGYQSKRVRQFSEWEMEGQLDINQIPFWLLMRVKGGVTPTQPAAGTDPTVYRWAFTPTITTNNLDTSTLWGWDPNVQRMRVEYAVMNNLTFTGENAGLVNISGGGIARFPEDDTQVAPAQSVGELIQNYPLFYLDTGSDAFGTTLVTGTLVDWSFELGDTYGDPKYLDASADFTRIARREEQPQPRLVLQVEAPDMTIYDLYTADTPVKARIRVEGSTISNAYKSYLQIDTYGKLTLTDLGTYASSNRTLQFEILGEYQSDLTADYKIEVQNTQATMD